MSQPHADKFLESQASATPALELLVKLGYTHLTPSQALAARGGKNSRVVLETVLAQHLARINSIHTKGEQHAYSDANIAKAVEAISQLPYDGLVPTSQTVYELLTLGKALEQTIAGTTKSYQLRYIDWDNPANNVFHVCDEFEVLRRNSKLTRRPDLVVFCNGIPFGIIECKRPDLKNAVGEAVSQHLRNQAPDEIPELYVHGHLLLALAQNQAQYATTDTPLNFWSSWREEYPDVQKKQLDALLGNTREVNAQDRGLHSLLSPKRALELLYRYVVFDTPIKKVARYQQYFAVQATIARIKETRGDQVRKGGVVWHTTGSGKSLTMVMLAKAITLEPSIINARVVLVTDRVDLDKQISDTFKNCGRDVKQARTGEELIELITAQKASVITAVVNKFTKVGGKKGIKDLSPNIFVLVDEGHRTQYGEMHAHMRNVFPNACYIGFTGTPLLAEDKKTATKFGGFIHAYTMGQAIADQAVTPLLYEGRHAELAGDKEQIDKWFERVTSDLNALQKADLKKKFRREEEVNKSEDRIQEIAFDIHTHFSQTFKGSGLKGQVAASSKATALRYKKYLDDFGGISSAVVISAPDTREGHETSDDSSTPDIQRFWKDMLARYGSEENYLKSTLRGFISGDEPELLIVVDKLLTGFDAPPNTVLYVDKRLNDHNILQAIARVNRLFDGKAHGLIIDYRGIFGAMRDAIDLYDALEADGFDRSDLDGVISDVTDEIAKLPERHAQVWGIFKSVADKSDIELIQQYLGSIDLREQFYDLLSAFARTLQIAVASARWQDITLHTTKQEYRNDLKFFIRLRTTVKHRYGEAVNYNSYEVQIRNLVNKYVGAEGITQVIAPIDIFASDSLEIELDKIEGDAAKADVIASRMKKTLTERMDEDPVLYKRLSELIDQTIADHRAKRIADAQYLQRTKAALTEMKQDSIDSLPSALAGRADARAYFRVTENLLGSLMLQPPGFRPMSTGGDTPQIRRSIRQNYVAQPASPWNAAKPISQELLAEIAIKFEQVVDAEKIRDWHNNIDVKNSILNAMEDYFDALEDERGLVIAPELRDRLNDELLQVAKNRDGR
jgi:type I restriction enzyme, R subunit